MNRDPIKPLDETHIDEHLEKVFSDSEKPFKKEIRNRFAGIVSKFYEFQIEGEEEDAKERFIQLCINEPSSVGEHFINSDLKIRPVFLNATLNVDDLINDAEESADDLKNLTSLIQKEANESRPLFPKFFEVEFIGKMQDYLKSAQRLTEKQVRVFYSNSLKHAEKMTLKFISEKHPTIKDMRAAVGRLPVMKHPDYHVRADVKVRDVESPVDVHIERPIGPPTEDTMLWAVIRNRTQALSFNSFVQFIENLDWTLGDEKTKERPLFQGVDAFKRLREFTESFLLSRAGILPFDDLDDADQMIVNAIQRRDANHLFTVDRLGSDRSKSKAEDYYPELDLTGRKQVTTKQTVGFDEETQDVDEPYADSDIIHDSFDRLGYTSPSEISKIKTSFVHSLKNGNNNDFLNPYLRLILEQFMLCGNYMFKCKNINGLNMPDVERARRPLFMELIWSYWQEQGLLTQTMKSVALRFQNKTRGRFDRLAHMEIDPLRPVNNLIWGYIQEEGGMLTVTRRNYEYQHQYGLVLSGHAVGGGRAADVRVQFLEAFHTLLSLCAEFFRQDDDRMVTSDAFPVLNALKEVHLYLSKGAHNQFGDLAWTARTEMLMEQWILSHNALREFIAGRIMVAYPERWQRQVDGMMSIQGWGDISCIHFNNLATFGEQILLSIRYVPWVNIHDQARAKLWAQFWRQEIQGYIHAYRAATGADLSGAYSMPQVNTAQPDPLIRKRRIANPALDRF